MIDFEISEAAMEVQKMAHDLAEGVFRKSARYYDDNEHEYIKETEEIRKKMDDIGLH